MYWNSSYELAFEMLKKALKGEFQRHWQLVSDSGRLTDADQKRYLRLRDLEGYSQILKYGVAFYRKECMVKK